LEVRSEAQERLKAMFCKLCDEPEWLPAHFQSRVRVVGVERAVGDYLAGMTDRYCDQHYQQLCSK
jgi:dGTPase